LHPDTIGTYARMWSRFSGIGSRKNPGTRGCNPLFFSLKI